MKAVICILIGTALVIGCVDTSYESTVRGKVINTGSKLPIDSVLVELQDGVGASGSFTIIDGETTNGLSNITYTNAKGEFEVQIDGEFEPWLSVGKEKHSYLKNNKVYHSGSLMAVGEGTLSGLIVEMEAEAFFDPTLVSKEPVGEYDYLKITFYSYEGPTEDNNRIHDRTWDDFRDEEEEYPHHFRTIGDKWLRYGITYERNKEFHHFVDSAYVPSFDTVFKTIYY